jgi:predicted ATPase
LQDLSEADIVVHTQDPNKQMQHMDIGSVGGGLYRYIAPITLFLFDVFEVGFIIA